MTGWLNLQCDTQNRVEASVCTWLRHWQDCSEQRPLEAVSREALKFPVLVLPGLERELGKRKWLCHFLILWYL